MPAPRLTLVCLGRDPLDEQTAPCLARLRAAGLGRFELVRELPRSGASAGVESVLVLAEPAQLLAALAPSATWSGGPLSVLGGRPDAAQAAELVAAGVMGWWPESLAGEDLVAALAMDRARWQRQQQLSQALARVQAQLDERKWVDRAKGVLMTARGIGENEAFTLLRGAAMHANLRMGELSRSVTEAAQWAEALNRAGQLRMLSQRLVKLAVQRWADLEARRARGEQDEALRRLSENLGHLQALPATDGQPARWAGALAEVVQACEALRVALDARLGAAMLRRVDDRAEALLTAAEGLSEAVAEASGRRALHIINLCGRQRMRVQRVAKQALLAQLLDDGDRRASLHTLLDDFEAVLRELDTAPLSSPEIRESLRAAHDEWLRLLRGLHGLDQEAGRLALAQASDALLQLFDRLTASYEHSLQVIMA